MKWWTGLALTSLGTVGSLVGCVVGFFVAATPIGLAAGTLAGMLTGAGIALFRESRHEAEKIQLQNENEIKFNELNRRLVDKEADNTKLKNYNAAIKVTNKKMNANLSAERAARIIATQSLKRRATHRASERNSVMNQQREGIIASSADAAEVAEVENNYRLQRL